jgi:hypothetical protein
MRPPVYPNFLAFMLGTGCQVFLILYLYLFSLAFGMVSVYFRVFWLVTIAMAAAGSSWINGFVTARIMRTFGCAEFYGGAAASALFYPMLTLICFMLVDFIEWIEKATNAIPLTSMFVYALLWAAVSVMCTCHGATWGYSTSSLDSHKERTSISSTRRSVPA